MVSLEAGCLLIPFNAGKQGSSMKSAMTFSIEMTRVEFTNVLVGKAWYPKPVIMPLDSIPVYRGLVKN
jgi:hypothetical protein